MNKNSFTILGVVVVAALLLFNLQKTANNLSTFLESSLSADKNSINT